MRLSRHATLLAAILSVAPLRAEPGVVITPASVRDRVHAQNPDLAAARLRIREAVGRMKQAGRLPNPELETSLEHDPRVRERKLEIGFTQRFPLTDRLRLEKEISATAFHAAEAEVRDVGRRLVAQAREGVVNVLAIREKRKLRDRQIRLTSELSEFLAGAVKRGETSRLDAAQAELEASRLGLEMRRLEIEESSAIDALKPLLGMLPGERLIVSGNLTATTLKHPEVNHAKRPDYQVAALEAAAAKTNVLLEEARKYEDVEAGWFAAAERTEDAPEGYDREALIGIRFRIPLPLWNRNEGAIEEAKARSERKDREAAALARSIHLEAEAARNEMSGFRTLLSEMENALIPLAERQAAAAEEAFRKGQGDLQSVFRHREKLLEVEEARLDVQRQFHLARVRHEASIGNP